MVEPANPFPGQPSPDSASLTVIQLTRWRAGDEQAFTDLFARSLPWLRVRVRHHRVWPVLANTMQVDDATQEVWTRAIEPVRERFRHEGPGSFLAFLGSIADRALVDLARVNGAQKRGSFSGARALQTDLEGVANRRPGLPATETPTSAARESELRQLARKVLNEREHDAWDLVELNHFTAEEAGEAMGDSGASVRSLLFRARAKLSARVQDADSCASA